MAISSSSIASMEFGSISSKQLQVEKKLVEILSRWLWFS
jgi:hypothetical protein